MKLDLEKMNGLVPAVVQDATTGQVLMLAYMNDEAWRRTVETGYATFFSRSRNSIWVKGETSGNKLRVREALTDCDQDAVVLRVDVAGPGVCHEGYQSCFYRSLVDGDWAMIAERAFDPERVYATV